MPPRRNPRTGVEDRWHRQDKKLGKVQSAKYGQGKRWRARWVEAGGREREKLFARKTDAEDYLDNVTAAVVTDQYVAPEGGDVLVGSVLDRFMAGVDVKRSTRQGYESAVKAHIRPRWGAVPLKAVTVSGIRSWLVDMQRGDPAGKTARARKGMTSGAARKTGRVFSMALDTAVDDKLIARNPFDRVKLPREAQPRQGMSLSRGQLHDLVNAMPSEQDRVLTLILGYSGLRWGEAVGLTAKAVDYQRRRLNVHRTYGEAGGSPYVETPKDHERRWVPFPPFLTTELQKVTAGKNADDDLFSNASGRPLQGSNWLPRVLRPALKAAKIPDVDGRIIHDLRHTYASLAVQAGANIKMLQKAMGHADPGFTLRVYADLFEDDYADLGDRLEPTAGQLRAMADPKVVNFPKKTG